MTKHQFKGVETGGLEPPTPALQIEHQRANRCQRVPGRASRRRPAGVQWQSMPTGDGRLAAFSPPRPPLFQPVFPLDALMRGRLEQGRFCRYR